ncbi:hypothetical protein V8G54_032614 [Vigna mungo]|uniref:Uncharacterized protein n=1 Tax=Vigna mungo TaxID=3915 RepID=A0AAQ3MLM2_VIGMU
MVGNLIVGDLIVGDFIVRYLIVGDFIVGTLIVCYLIVSDFIGSDLIVSDFIVGHLIVGDLIVDDFIVGNLIVGDHIMVDFIVGHLVVGDFIVGELIVGDFIVGNLIVGYLLVGDLIVSDFIVGDLIVSDFIVGNIVVGDLIAGDFIVGNLIMGDLIVGDFIVGVLIVGDFIVGDLVVGDFIVSELIVGDLIMGDFIVGDVILGDFMVGDLIVGDLIVGDFIRFIVGDLIMGDFVVGDLIVGDFILGDVIVGELIVGGLAFCAVTSATLHPLPPQPSINHSCTHFRHNLRSKGRCEWVVHGFVGAFVERATALHGGLPSRPFFFAEPAPTLRSYRSRQEHHRGPSSSYHKDHQSRPEILPPSTKPATDVLAGIAAVTSTTTPLSFLSTQGFPFFYLRYQKSTPAPATLSTVVEDENENVFRMSDLVGYDDMRISGGGDDAMGVLLCNNDGMVSVMEAIGWGFPVEEMTQWGQLGVMAKLKGVVGSVKDKDLEDGISHQWSNGGVLMILGMQSWVIRETGKDERDKRSSNRR